jgi:hypothetical protein
MMDRWPSRTAAVDRGRARFGIACGDSQGRARIRAGNWECFGAPAALFCYLVTDGPAAARDAWQQALAILDDCCHPGAGQVRAKIRDHERASPRT